MNVEFILSDFLSLECGEYGQIKADIVFLNPHIEFPVDSIKSDIFNSSSPPLLRAMKNAYKISKNIGILLPYYIDVN